MISNNNLSRLQDSTKSLEYEKYEDLTGFEDIENFDIQQQIVFMIRDESNWTNQYMAINDLRRLHKFYPELFNKTLAQVIDVIPKLTASIRSNLSKIIIMLIKEIFGSKTVMSSIGNKNIKVLISSCVVQSASIKAFIKEECSLALGNLSSNCSFFSLVIIHFLLDEMSSKNLQISENATITATQMIENWSKNSDIVSETSINEWEIIINQILNLHSLKREPYIKRACNLAELIHEKIGTDTLQYILKEIKLDEMNKKVIWDMIKTSQIAKNKNKKNTSIKELISKDKSKFNK